MRKHNFQIHVKSNGHSAYSSDSIKNERTRYTERRSPLSGGSAYTFTSTDFDHCESQQSSADGGALCCLLGSLTIEDCSFTNCQSVNRSGAVFFQSQNLCNDTNNLFVNCSSDWHSGTFDDWSATKSIHSESKYINSDAGGGCGIMNVEATPDGTLSSCIFINGTAALHSGLLCITKIKGHVKVSNCIFSKGSAKAWGGGFGTYENYTGTPRPYFYYSFFCNNVCSDQNRGADFDANGTTGQYYTKDKIIHCFSSSRGHRVYIEGKSADVDNWLPQG